MNESVRLRLVVLCGALLLLSSCTQVAITGRQQLNLVPDSVVNSMSFDSYNEFLSQHQLSNNMEHLSLIHI